MPGYIAEALRKEQEELAARQSLRKDFISDMGEVLISADLMKATKELGYIPPDIHDQVIERLGIAYDAGAITGNDQYDIAKALNSTVDHYADLNQARQASGMTSLSAELPAHTEDRAAFFERLNGQLPLRLYEELENEKSWERASANAPTIRTLALDNYDVRSPEHEQRLAICDQYRAKLEQGYGETDGDSYITRGEYREAIAFASQIRGAIEEGKSISHEDLSRTVYEPGSGYDWSDRAVAEGASSKISTLITQLEATGYRFIEPPEGIPSQELLQHARAVELPQGWSWEERQLHRGDETSFVLHNDRGEFVAAAGQQMFDNGHSYYGSGGPSLDSMYVDNINDARALALYAAVQYSQLDPDNTCFAGQMTWEDLRLADVPSRTEANRTYAQLAVTQQLDIVGDHFRQFIAEKGYELDARIPDQVYIEAAEHAKTINPAYADVANYIAGDCINANHSTAYGADLADVPTRAQAQEAQQQIETGWTMTMEDPRDVPTRAEVNYSHQTDRLPEATLAAAPTESEEKLDLIREQLQDIAKVASRGSGSWYELYSQEFTAEVDRWVSRPDIDAETKEMIIKEAAALGDYSPNPGGYWRADIENSDLRFVPTRAEVQEEMRQIEMPWDRTPDSIGVQSVSTSSASHNQPAQDRALTEPSWTDLHPPDHHHQAQSQAQSAPQNSQGFEMSL